MTELEQIIGESIGEASMLWDKDNVFESTKAEELMIRTIEKIKKSIWSEAVKDVQDWKNLLIKAHQECPYADPKEALREHNNKMNLLGVIEVKFRKKSGENPKEIFKNLTR